jgi:neutral ceramidase
MASAGFAQTEISCAVGTPLGGNARVDKAARGVHDPLHATVAVIESAAGAQVLIGLDLVSAPRALVEAISREVEARTGIPATSVTVSATHTHSGPDVGRGDGMDELDYAAVGAWQRDAVSAIGVAAADAHRGAVPATLNLASGCVPRLSFNRRLAHIDGTTHMNWETLEAGDVLTALGPIDPELLVLVFSDEHGVPLGSLVHFTLHPAILVGHDWLVSADYVAEMSDTVSAALGGAPVLFLNGALGNINHIDYRDSGRAIGFGESARVGTALGRAAVDALTREKIELDLADGEWHTMTITLNQRTVDRPQLERAREVLVANAGQPVEALDGIPPEAYALWTIQVGRWLPPLLEVAVTFVRLDRVVLVYVPFEVFVEFGLDLRRAFPDSIVRVVSLGGGYYGYLPTAKAFAEGGYEPTLGTSTIECGQGEYVFHQITTELRAMLHRGRDR